MTSPQIIEVKKRFADAEAAIKRYERIGLDNVVSAVNELRYAGEHILTAETATDPEACEAALLRAERHCIRAKYDAVESTIVTLLEQIAAVRQSGFSAKEMSSVFPEWRECLAKAVEAQKVIETAGAVRDADPSALETALSKLMAYRYKLLAIEPQIVALRNEFLDRQEAEKRRCAQLAAEVAESRERAAKVLQARQFLLSFSATIAGTVVGLLGTLLAILGTFPNYRFIGVVVGLSGFVMLCVVIYQWSAAKLIPKESLALLKSDITRRE